MMRIKMFIPRELKQQQHWSWQPQLKNPCKELGQFAAI
jgi:hypothetical protein